MTQMVVSVTCYCFREKLLELERVSKGELSVPIPGTEEIVTPLDWNVWEEELERHPDMEWVKFLVKRIKEGFWLGQEQRIGNQWIIYQHHISVFAMLSCLPSCSMLFFSLFFFISFSFFFLSTFLLKA